MTLSEDILSTTMDVVLQWGPDRGIPEPDRIRTVHPELSDDEVQQSRNIAYQVLIAAINEIAPSLKMNEISRDEAVGKLRSIWPWLSDEQALKAIGQGEYYHWRETGG